MMRMNVIENRLKDLDKALDDLRDIMKVINEDINSGLLITDNIQQSIIVKYADMGRRLIDEKDYLNNYFTHLD
jgi:hypothetical protein